MIHPTSNEEYEQRVVEILEHLDDDGHIEWFDEDAEGVAAHFVATYYPEYDTVSTTAYEFTPNSVDLNLCPMSIVSLSHHSINGGLEHDLFSAAVEKLVGDMRRLLLEGVLDE